MREKITWPGARIKKKEEGMPNYENNHVKGDLYITFDVEFPRGGLSDSEKDGRLRLVLRYMQILFVFMLLFISISNVVLLFIFIQIILFSLS